MLDTSEYTYILLNTWSDEQRIYKMARSEDFKRGGEISNVVVFKKILKN